VTAILLALGSSVAYGLTDFLGGLAARRAHIFLLGSVTQPLGLVVLLVIAPLVGGEMNREVWFWGVVSGLGGALAYVTLFRALAIGPMSVASPVSAIIAVVLPVLAGVLFGERLPLVGWVGIAVGILAVLMVSQVHEDAPHPVSLQVLLLSIAAGVFISVFLVALERAPSNSGLWPIVIVRIVTSTLLLVAALATRVMAKPPRDVFLLASASTLLDVLATVAFMLATREGLLTVVAVITALYPAATVLMARVVLKEHLQVMQRIGLLLAAVSVGVLAAVA
jgi:drug/metabolite transporter (DMT)-like permease